MVPRRNTSIAAVAVALLANSVQAQSQDTEGAPVASCADLECNLIPNGTLAQCDIQGREHSAIGAVPFTSPFNTSSNLTWTEGSVFDYPNGILAAVFVRDFFLGVPKDLNLRDEGDVQGCAAFFVDSNATFPLYQPPGTCSDTIGADCAKALEKQAGDIANNGDKIESSSDLCSRMQDAFSNSTPPSECSKMALNGTEWGRIMFRPLTGPSAPTIPTQSQNSSSNCHPVLNNTSPYQLAHTLTFNATRGSDPLWNSSIHSIYDMHHPPSKPDGGNIYLFIQHQAVPILSVFAGQGTVQTSVSCLEAPTEFSESGEAESGAVGGPRVSVVLVGLGLLGALFAGM